MSLEHRVTSVDLLAAFRTHYHQFEVGVQDALANETDPTVLARLGDNLDDFMALVMQVTI